MSKKISLRSLLARLSKVVGKVVPRRRKPRTKPANGTPGWLAIGVSPDGTRRQYYIKLRLPRKVLLAYLHARRFIQRHRLWSRIVAIGLVILIICGLIFEFYTPKKRIIEYNLSGMESRLIGDPVKKYESKIEHDQKTDMIQFNSGYTPQSDTQGDGSPKISANFGAGADRTVTVNDPVNNLSIGFKPLFAVARPQKNVNRIVYPLMNKNAAVVYSIKGVGIKEDIILRAAGADKMSFSYELKLGNQLEARLDTEGNLNIYGAMSALNGNVSTGSDADAQLLEKARKNAKKDKLIFTIPAPYIKEDRDHKSQAKTWYTLDGTKLTIHADNLKTAAYPLSIDPSIFVQSAAQLMRGNNETNIDFDIDNGLIQKSQTTGARIDAWSSTNDLTSAVYGQGTAVAGGYIYSAGGVGSSTTVTTTFYAAGADTFPVPAGVTTVTVKAWGGGGGGGSGGNSSGVGGDGGGGGYAKAVIGVTPLETLDVLVGAGGAKGGANNKGGDGGGYSSVKRSSTFLVQAGGGGGGGGSIGTGSAGDGGAGGGAIAVSGTAGSGGTAGGGLGVRGNTTTSTSGTGGAAGSNGAAGANGTTNAGGDAGGSTTSSNCNTSVVGQTGHATNTHGAGGKGGRTTAACEGGGGGGGGAYGGGGGGSANNTNRRSGGGGGGSSLVTGSSTVETAGSGTTPGNSSDSDRNGAGVGGTGGTRNNNTTAGADGAVVISYTVPGTVSNAIYWAQFHPTDRSIISPRPDGTNYCSGWCTDSAYNLPVALKNLSLVAYNGYLYAIGGENSSGVPQSSVYIAKLGANGEPQLWHPTDSNKNNWVYWYADTALSNARSQFGAVAYNNRIYILGGLTTSTTLLTTNTVQAATINPAGTLNSWTATGMQAITGGTGRYGLSAQVYNDTLYILGGNASFGGATLATAEYAKLNSNGTMNSWVATSSIQTTGRTSLGGVFSTIFGGYVYVAGGCSVVDSSNYCTSIATDVQVSSINADGSLAGFNTILNLTMDRFGHTLIAWQGGLYRLGGCRAQDTGTGLCTDTVLDVDYGVINEEGEASTVATSVTIGTGECNGGSAYNCDLPGPTESALVGNVLNGSAILNGYLYIWGGCSNATGTGCSSVSRGVIYTSVGSDGSLTKPSSCGSFSSLVNSSWCYNTTSLTAGMGAPGVAVANGYIYSIGGFTASGMLGNIYYASPDASNGSISSWSSIALTGGGGMGATSVSYPYSFIRANPASAGTNPYNLFIIGGCIGATGIGCPSTGGYTDTVYKCNINTSGAPVAGSCSTSGQMQIGTVPGATDTGLGAMTGTVYANYIYLMGGLAESATDLKTTRYAKIDNSNNIVNVTTGTTTGGWTESSSLTYYGRRRGAGFGYNGYLYVVGGYDGSGGGGGVLADIEFAKINVSDGSIGAWNVSSVSINQRWGLSLAISNSYAYVIGGCISGSAPTCNSAGWTNSIQEFQIYNNDSGAISSYGSSSTCAGANTGPCPGANGVDRIGGSSTIMNGYIYYAGGCSTVNCSIVVSNTYYAPIDSYGVVGAWSSGGALPAAKAWGKLVNTGGTLYYLGGQTTSANTSATSTVYYSSSIASGNPTWTGTTTGITNTAGTAQTRSQFGATVWNGRIYVVGGYNSGGTAQATVLVSPQLNSGGNITSNWSSGSTSFNVARAGLSAVAYANNLYVLGGNDGTNYLSDVQFSQINTGTGNAGSWTYSTSLPAPLSDSDAFAANGYMYLAGGRSAASTCRPITIFAPISANTTIATGNNPTGVGAWSETNQKYTGDRYGAAAAYANGRVYLVGGGCTAFVGSSDRMYSSTLKSQPQIAKYSRLMDTDTNVFPNSFLINGLDNSIGARWQAQYQSAVDTSNVVLQQSFDDGTSGNNVVVGTSNYDSCTATGSMTNKYSNAQYVTAGNSMRLQVTSGSGTGGCTDAFTANTVRYDRFYMYFDGLGALSGATAIYKLVNSANTADPLAQVRLSTTGTLQLLDKTTQEAVTTALTANTWNRIEFGFSGGQLIVRTFQGANANGMVPDQIQVITLNNSAYTQADTVSVGINDSINATWGMYIDEHVASSNTWVGPAVKTWGQTYTYGNVTMGDVAPYRSYAATYSTGTITQSGTTVTAGGGAVFVPEMVGGTITYLDGTTNTITAVAQSGASLTVTTTKTIGSAQAYSISRVDTQFARWYYFSINIDASQTFGYPEDVDRGPTIWDLSLFFTADPNKRLRHGKTFTGGELQPLDTPCRQSVDSDCPLP